MLVTFYKAESYFAYTKTNNMLQKKLLSLLLPVLFSTTTMAQGLFVPNNVNEAYAKGTRSKDGKPGPNYWQNTGNYVINVKVNPPSKTITGTETITYTNNSPETLKNLNIKLILNIHKPGAARQNGVSADYLSTGIIIDKYTENGEVRKIRDAGANTTLRIAMAKPLAPKSSVVVTFDWHYDVSEESGREGKLDSTSFFLAYFYPRISVFDDIHGWDWMTFTDAQEFYNDFNNYELNVTVPKNYMVWATGELQNANEVYQPTVVEKFNAAKAASKTINVITQADIDAKNVTTQNETNTFKWKATNVSDMAACISNHYVWDAASVEVDAKTKRRSLVQAAYVNSSTHFKTLVENNIKTLAFYSTQWPGVPYPFPSSTIAQGFADMEYPMMANDNAQQDVSFQNFVADHEIGHTYFPFYMGINEHRYGFMDEGWTTAFENLIGQSKVGVENANDLFKQFRVTNWVKDNDQEHQVPIITPTNILSGAALGDNEYGKAALAYLGLKDMLGDDLFKKSLHGFMDRWNGKHPIPWDMFNSFSNISGKDLTWYWNNWFFTSHGIDLALKTVKTNPNGAALTIDNVGGFAIPTNVLVEYADGTKEKKHFTPAIWEKNQKQATVNITTKKKIVYVKLDNGIFMDYNEKDNNWGKSNEKVFDASKTSAGDLDKFLGAYNSESIPVVLTFTKDGNKLVVDIPGQGALPLKQTAENKFTFDEAGAVFTFTPEKNELTLEQGGGKFNFKKK
jgi:hypothetical protein